MIIQIHISPNASKNELIGWQGNAVKIKIAAPPEKGKANKELIKFLSKKWDIAQSNIQILKGTTNRRKIVEFIGIDELPLPENPQAELFS